MVECRRRKRDLRDRGGPVESWTRQEHGVAPTRAEFGAAPACLVLSPMAVDALCRPHWPLSGEGMRKAQRVQQCQYRILVLLPGEKVGAIKHNQDDTAGLLNSTAARVANTPTLSPSHTHPSLQEAVRDLPDTGTGRSPAIAED